MKHLISILIALLFILPGPAYSQTCDCDISQRKVEAYDALLDLDPAEQAEAVLTHLPWGVPVSPLSATNEHLLHQTNYILHYDDDLRVPIWAAYRLRKQDVEANLERIEILS